MNQGHAGQVVDLLRELDRIIAAHGLTQYRFPVEFLANSLEDGSFGLPGVMTELLTSKISALREDVLQELERRVGKGGTTVTNSTSELVRAREIARLLRECGILLETARHDSAERARNLPLLMQTILEAATTDLFQAYLDGLDSRSPEARGIVTRAIGRQVAGAVTAIRDRLEQCRTAVAGLLRSAKEMMPSELAPHPELASCLWLNPRFDPSSVARRLHLRPVGVWRLLGQAAVRRRIHRQLAYTLHDGLCESLNAYSSLMRKWVRRSFCALELALSAITQTYQAPHTKSLPSPEAEAKLLQAEEDLCRLKEWPEAGHPLNTCIRGVPVKPESSEA